MRDYIYTHVGSFYLLDYSPSHSELVIRHRDKQNHVNVDVFFKGVQFINIKPRFENLHVFIVTDTSLREQITAEDEFSVFGIENNKGEVFYIVAYFFCVFKNALNILETPIGDFMWTKENERIFTSQ